jgi:hypothetical protein
MFGKERHGLMEDAPRDLTNIHRHVGISDVLCA